MKNLKKGKIMVGAQYKATYKRNAQRTKKKLFFFITSMITRVLTSALLWGVVGACLSIFLLVSLYSFDSHDNSWFYYASDNHEIRNYAGVWGAQVAAFCFYFLGSAAYVVVLLCALIAYIAFKYKEFSGNKERCIAGLFFVITSAVYIHYQDQFALSYMQSGGIVGEQVYLFLLKFFDRWCLFLFLVVALVAEILIIIRLSFLICMQRLI